MKILHISDVHGDKEALDKVREFAQKRDDLEVVVASGDFPGVCLDNDTAKNMNHAFQLIRGSVKIPEDMAFNDVLVHIIKDPKAPNELTEAAKFYKMAEQIFDRNVEQEYMEVEKILSKFPQRVMTVPGNWDSPQYRKILAQYDIHQGETEASGVTFAGFGGNNMLPIVIPPTRSPYFDDKESFTFLVEADPDVAVVHTPPYGYLDGDEGNFSTAAYIYKEKPTLLLCGHMNGALGCVKVEDTGTVVSNSGNLGKYMDQKHSGTLAEFELEDNRITNVHPYIIRDCEVQEIKPNSN